MPDQADNLRELVREALVTAGAENPPGVCLTVVGSTPGVGATTVLAATAHELASLGQRVLSVDANLARPALGTRLGLSAAAGLTDVLSGRRRLCEATVPAPFGAALLHPADTTPAAGETPPGDAAARHRLSAELLAARERFDVVLIDLGSGLSPWGEWLCRRAGAVLVVASTTGDDIRGAYAIIKALAGATPTRLALNRSTDARSARNVAQRIGETANQFLGRNPLAGEPAVIPTYDEADCADHRRACRLLAAELLVPQRIVHYRRTLAPRGSAAASTSAAPSLERRW